MYTPLRTSFYKQSFTMVLTCSVRRPLGQSFRKPLCLKQIENLKPDRFILWTGHKFILKEQLTWDGSAKSPLDVYE